MRPGVVGLSLFCLWFSLRFRYFERQAHLTAKIQWQKAKNSRLTRQKTHGVKQIACIHDTEITNAFGPFGTILRFFGPHVTRFQYLTDIYRYLDVLSGFFIYLLHPALSLSNLEKLSVFFFIFALFQARQLPMLPMSRSDPG